MRYGRYKMHYLLIATFFSRTIGSQIPVGIAKVSILHSKLQNSELDKLENLDLDSPEKSE